MKLHHLISNISRCRSLQSHQSILQCTTHCFCSPMHSIAGSLQLHDTKQKGRAEARRACLCSSTLLFQLRSLMHISTKQRISDISSSDRSSQWQANLPCLFMSPSACQASRKMYHRHLPCDAQSPAMPTTELVVELLWCNPQDGAALSLVEFPNCRPKGCTENQAHAF